LSKRLLFVVNNLDFFISHRLEIGLAVLAEGWQVRVLGPVNPEARVFLTAKGFDVEPVDVAQEDHSLAGQWRFLCSVYRVCRGFRPDICHMITLKTFLVAGVASRLAGVCKRIGSVSGLGFFFISNDWKTRFSRWLYRPLFRFAMSSQATEVIFQNEDDRNLLCDFAYIDRKKTHLIPGSGVDLSRFTFLPEPPAPVVFVLIGRMLKDKGVIEFVQAAKTLLNKGIQARFVLAGMPDETNPASLSLAQLEAWNAEGTVEWMGFVKDIPELIASTHVVVLPSYREGFPRVLIEAAAAGRPSVTTDVPGCRHAILNNETGILVSVCDDEALAKAMEQLANDSDLRTRMGTRARELAEEKYAIEAVVETHLDIYQAGRE
jgi:glycosyltransferase involved in cell wall biosynthesis